jgi:hypothetical protein
MEHSSFVRVSLAVVAATVMMGCVASEVRQGADLLAAFTHQVSEEGAEFVQSRTMLAKARRANIAMLEVNAVELEDSVSRDLAVWRLSGQVGKRRVELFEGIRAYANSTASRSTELANLRKRHEASISAAKSAVDVRQAELTKVSKGLASLARDPDLRSELKFFAAYFKEVSAGIENAKEDAKERVKAAEKAAKNVAPQNDGTK